jgi:lipopolysaccharide/colanic/teichoic acid biosynthesis glycosyltransferase
VLGPLIVLLILLIRVSSRGAAIFAQSRVGMRGRVFTLYKLRSMRMDAELITGPKWAALNDFRCTPLGRWLRATHLDELPQLINVIRGDMALVGPRPERPEFVDILTAQIPGYLERHSVRPGITGLAQILLPPDQTLDDVRRKLAVDLYYIRNRNFWMDFRLMTFTALRLVRVPAWVCGKILRIPALDAILETEPSEAMVVPHARSKLEFPYALREGI